MTLFIRTSGHFFRENFLESLPLLSPTLEYQQADLPDSFSVLWALQSFRQVVPQKQC
jgi:hypothetical protein